ncbi:DNA translocase FtsK [Sporosarcina sp. G11-34]|uniref:DNA translocase FtsK n=1 Tax=Sporosarcina sp. G11-34 TaxID=2849605 RepID=UPI0022A926E1|nr:DNA translocase FtsK [Sporosarcina sp. G11-34]
MKWYKKLLNRFFDNDVDENENNEIDDYETNFNEIEDEKIRIEKPAFRFPIITDSEIYGWDENEPTIEKEHPENLINVLETDPDLYKPTPLYENERWPSEQSGGRVFRAGAEPKYRVDIALPKGPTSTDRKVVKPESPLTKKTVIQKRSNRPFTPTAVPSPIHGFNVPSEKPSIEEVEKVSLSEKDEPVVVNKTEQELLENYSLAEEVAEPVIIREEEQVEPVKFNQPVEESIQSIDEEIKSEEPLLEALVEDSVEEEFTAVDSDSDKVRDIPATEPVIVVEEDEQLTEEVVVEKKKEKTVPFNVLMLKSDKEKIMNQMPKPIEKKVDVKKKVPKENDVMDEELPHYVLPSIDFLIPPETQIEDTEWLESQSTKLVEALSHFAVKANIIEAMQGPTVTRFELTVGQGTKVSKIRNLTDDLKLALAAEDIRIQAPIPGKSSIGIEIPNRTTRPVRISEVISTKKFQDSTSPLEAVLGLSLTGTPLTLDLRKMPHGMIAGATGSGKSVCINSILVSLLYKASPSDLKMMLIDPKMVELAPFNGIPHLISPVITDVKAATAALKWAVGEMERRYELLAHAGVRDIERYNKAAIESRRFSMKMPYLLIVIDELADLMMMAPADVEVSISRIAQKARACGIHLIIATQRPSVDVITGTIKANIPTRIAFSVSSQIDSRTIIDTQGAERLLGKGDMLYIGNGKSSAVRLQGTFVTDDEIERIIEHVQSEATPTYLFGQEELLASVVEEDSDPLFEDACLFIYEQDSASTSLLQRNFSIGYNRAAKLMDRMEKKGFISGQRGSKARDVYLTEKDLGRLTESLELNV